MKTAVIDLGSNSARMTIRDGERVMYNKRIYVRLSEGLSEDDYLKPLPMERTLAALTEFAEVIADENCAFCRTVATAAMRRAKNAALFAARIEAVTGLTLEILSGDDESYYDFCASKSLFGTGDAFLMDVGGGSLELIRVVGGQYAGHVCLPYGAVVTTDRFGRDEPTLADFFRQTFRSLPLLRDAAPCPVIGLGGAIRSLFSYSVGKKQGTRLDAASFFAIYSEIAAKTPEELAASESFRDRHDVAVAGLAPFRVLAELVGAPEIILNNGGVREGIFSCMNLK